MVNVRLISINLKLSDLAEKSCNFFFSNYKDLWLLSDGCLISRKSK